MFSPFRLSFLVSRVPVNRVAAGTRSSLWGMGPFSLGCLVEVWLSSTACSFLPSRTVFYLCYFFWTETPHKLSDLCSEPRFPLEKSLWIEYGKDDISFFFVVKGQHSWHQGHSITSPALCSEGFGILDIFSACFMDTITACIKEQFITAKALLIAWCPQWTHKDGWIIKGCKKSLLEVSLLH